MNPVVHIQDLSISFPTEHGNNIAVEQVSLVLPRGEIMALVGESGSGKSVTALSVLQLLPTRCKINGKVLFYDKDEEPLDLLSLSEKKISVVRGNRIAMIFQEPMTSLNPVFTCGKQVMEAIRHHQKIPASAAKKKTIELFKKVKLADPESILRRYPHQLSGGQKQRIMIAMAISCNPILLIADEPTTALDVTIQKNILELIKELQLQNDMAVLLITHDLGIVADIADKIAVLLRGEIVEQGIASSILQNPQHPYTKALLACRPAVHSRGERLPVVSDFLTGKQQPSSDPVAIKSKNPIIADRQPLLQVENLKVYFPLKKTFLGKSTSYFKAVDDVSFSVQQSETVGLVGESGCGKTTLGRAILQLIKPVAGKIIFQGKDIGQMKPGVLRNIRKDLQIVFQDPYGSLNPRMTIGSAIIEPMKVHSLFHNYSQRKEKAIDLLEKTGLSDSHFNRYPHQFSGGQRQRICIARALALNPSFIIFDESVSALDVSVQAQVLNLLNDLKSIFDFTSVFISHDLSLVHYFCDRILVMHKGKIVEEGDTDQIYYRPASIYTQQLMDTIPGKKLYQL